MPRSFFFALRPARLRMKSSALLLLASVALAASAARGAAPAPAPLPDPLDLKGAIIYALDHNFPILQAREQIRQQEGVVMQVQAPGIPNLSANGNYQRNAASTNPGFLSSTSNWSAELRVTQTLFAGGGIHASVRNARLVREAALAALQATIDAALLDVRTKFYSVLLAREKVRVQEENIHLFQGQLKDSQNQFHAGTVSNFELLRAQVSLANAQPDLITARNDLRIAIEQLRQSLGVPPARGPGAPAFPQLSGSLEYAPAQYDLDSALVAARTNRPELQQLSKLEEAGEQGVVTARSTYYPNVGLFGGYEWDGEELPSNGFTGIPGLVLPSSYSGHGWLAGVQSNWSIFDGRATAGKVVQAKSQLRQAQLTQSQEGLQIEVDVRQAFSSWEEANELVNATQKTVEQAVEALRLANNRFKAGSATQLDVLTSQVALTQARTNQLQANYNNLVAVAAMRKAIGQSDALVSP